MVLASEKCWIVGLVGWNVRGWPDKINVRKNKNISNLLYDMILTLFLIQAYDKTQRTSTTKYVN